MSADERSALSSRLSKLESHLSEENPILLKIVQSFRTLDRVAHALGLLARSESFATRVPWWPLISILGTFSSGKSTFINTYLGQAIQQSGNQAVDDKFTVICYGAGAESRVLPGLALDADPRFPFYQISYEIDQVADGEGRRVDAYLQLKTSGSERLRGKIIIDSPGFDADEQRTSTLRITDHIVGLSDLVLVFFDARHPEPGAMQDTLEHLVANTISRPDSNKFLYVLNQIDNTAREDNPEEVIAAWQRALANKGLTAGRFYRIYDKNAAVPIENEHLRRRFESKRDEDLSAIHSRMQQVEVERAYRIVGVLEKLARSIEKDYVPLLAEGKRHWRRLVLWTDLVLAGVLVALALALTVQAGYWEGLDFRAPAWLSGRPWLGWALLGVVLLGLGYVHHQVRGWAARRTLKRLQRRMQRDDQLREAQELLVPAFRKNTRSWSPLLWSKPIGWNRGARRRLARVLADADGYVQALNDEFADPSGARTANVTSPPGPQSTAPPAAPQPEPPASAVTPG